MLIYVQLVDRAIEIVADRGIAKRVPQAEWDAICRAMEHAFRAQRFEQGERVGRRWTFMVLELEERERYWNCQQRHQVEAERGSYSPIKFVSVWRS